MCVEISRLWSAINSNCQHQRFFGSYFPSTKNVFVRMSAFCRCGLPGIVSRNRDADKQFRRNGFVMSFDALLKFVCTGRSEESSKSVQSVCFSPYPSTVSDLKTAIQDRFQIPKCLQSISISSDPATLTDSQQIRSLYIHPGEYFTVTYLDRANIESCTKYSPYFPSYIKELQNLESRTTFGEHI